MDNITIRPALETDSEHIITLVNDAYRGASGQLGWTHEAALLGGTRLKPKHISESLQQADKLILVVEGTESILACIQLENKVDHAFLGMFAVAPESQAQGIGSQLLEHAEQYCFKNWNIHHLNMLVVSGRDELVAYYQRRGYQSKGTYAEFPVHLDVGTPLVDNLMIELLEKRYAFKPE
ncbi:MAG: GNAT family N-acetyltransferase, partial [Gammaproteobacteria bacterium]|nr:GNAT family N-acetyltransferase [Gammaproteobacteria bacterium]